MKRIYAVFFILALVGAYSLVRHGPVALSLDSGPTPTPTSSTSPYSGTASEVEGAILEAMALQRDTSITYLVYQVEVQNLVLSEDQTWASGWLVLKDPQTGEVIPTEPGLVLAEWDGTQWQVYLPTDPGWSTAVQAAPSDVLSPEEKAHLLAVNEAFMGALPTAPLRGYLLPWAEGITEYLGGSTSHDSYITSGNAHYSFDFFIPQTMFPILASKAGTVWAFRDTIPNGDPNTPNYIVLEDVTTTPTTYQLYLHLAQGSIPPSLRAKGAQVVQGQFIGTADDTGYSTGHHLHFQVEASPYMDNYWGVSVDMVFDDVNINGGRPRRNDNVVNDFKYCTRPDDVCVNQRAAYVSANTPAGDVALPVGDLTNPPHGSLVEASTLSLTGWASDADSGLYSAQFRAYYGNVWYDIGPVFSGPNLSYQWDMCSANVPDGPVSLAIKAMDMDGNQAYLLGLRHVTKNYTCAVPPPPACEPGANQVALYASPNFTGACRLYGIGDYANIDNLGNNEVESIQVGGNVKAALYSRLDFLGRGETFVNDDINLSNNILNSNTASSMKVMSASSAPAIPALVWPAPRETYTATHSLSLGWTDAGGATQFQARLTGPSGTSTTALQAESYWNLGSLSAGSYSWQVRADGSDWSTARPFTIVSSSEVPPSAVTAPYSATMESDTSTWDATGLWHLSTTPIAAHSETHYWWYGGGAAGSENYNTTRPGDLTTRPIQIPAAGYYLRFWYRYQTETSGKYWDQRWVQISADGGPYQNILQLMGDPFDNWLRSPAIDLSAYAGKTIRVRFHFHALDTYHNDYQGWFIDDVGITQTPPPDCANSAEPNNTPAQAVQVSYGQSISAEICPGGDYDYYKFVGSTGDRLIADIDASILGSSLDSYLYLLDSDGKNVIAQNDDEVAFQRLDSLIGYRLPHAGTYYLRVKAWNHPSVGGNEYFYTLRLSTDVVDPTAAITYPLSNTYIPTVPFDITVSAQDNQSGVSRVEFFWHSSYWLNTPWKLLGTDWDGSDGWSLTFDPSSEIEQTQGAIYAMVYDGAGNVMGNGAWNLRIDRSLPVTAMKPLSATQPATAFKLQWSGSDSGPGLDHYDIQWQVDGGTWQDLALSLDASVTSTWVVGQGGHTYSFHMRGVDRAGNAEAYPSSAETSTTIIADFCSAPDSFETDNTSDSATEITLGNEGQVHNFCNPAASDRLNDEDWVKFNASAGKRYTVYTAPLAESAATSLVLYASDATTVLAQVSANTLGAPTTIHWIASQNGWVYIRIRHLDGRVAGNVVTYRVGIVDRIFYLPVTRR